ncbi:radical SAM protein [Geotalea sp. SG265]|uniref:radical SAM protein n=1 Tax=Geotalea sp. SG265 TaxID=2922867 RepID=UPI001FAF5450|nr:radical SAM protein [Geotalea sp. SG265]
MSWKIIEKYRHILACEDSITVKKSVAGLRVCLVYPNRYHAAMSNLGFQAVHGLLNSYPDVLCERAFLPDREELDEYAKSGSRLLSLESQRPVNEFDIVAFSISFESDYLNIPVIFKLAGIPAFAADRGDAMPLVMAGGAALFLNPEPVADFLDLVCLGEAEPMLPALLEVLTREEQIARSQLLERCAAVDGVYVPSLYTVAYDGAAVALRKAQGSAPPTVRRLWDRDHVSPPTASTILTENTEFGDMYLVEVARGCPRGCRFCAAGFIYLPYRQRNMAAVKEEVLKGLEKRKKIGLVGAAVSDYRGVGELARFIVDNGGKVSVASLRIDCLEPQLVDALKDSGHKTVALAPEGGSQRLRDLIKKNINEEQILAACDELIGRDILNLKLYFIIGLPTETSEDLDELIALVGKVRERVIAAAKKNKRLGDVLLSVNPFIPKPFTPFQWCAMEDLKSLEKKERYLQKGIAPLSNVRMQMEGLKEAYLQALLSRGDRRLAPLILRGAEIGWKKAVREQKVDTDAWVRREIPLEEELPWDFIDSGDREKLVSEYRKAFEK